MYYHYYHNNNQYLHVHSIYNVVYAINTLYTQHDNNVCSTVYSMNGRNNNNILSCRTNNLNLRFNLIYPAYKSKS